MEVRLYRGVDGAMHPCLPHDAELIGKLKVGEIVAFKGRKPRNAKNHRRFFAMLRCVMDFTEKYEHEEHLLTELKIRMGHYDHYITADGEMVYLPKSINFDSMEEPEFGVFFDKALDAVFQHIVPDIDRSLLEHAMSELIRFG